MARTTRDEAKQDDQPRGGRRSPGPRRRLSREGIVDAAIQVIEADGLAALTMRRLADELGVAPGTLYTYVSNRTALVTLILDTVVERDDLPHELPGSWREKLESWARSDFDHFCAQPWVLDLRASVREAGPNMITWFDSALRVFDGFGVPEETKLNMLGTLDAYVIGSAFAHTETLTPDQPASEMKHAAIAAYEAAPALQRALAHAPRTFGTERFEFGLACLLDGFTSVLGQPGS
ncbi:AcrR family transcriptional regulator [Lipingzhangella halophila]|uniref:AcrR family transcriptional regulator n=1 Tax=Lipingzhangella halophila TaxID=1783352 RepID=A0A7W7W2N6_9ACTN|nr:TetR/AcrR family transcriptional regulator C-terminal domain-containing protein [Lipingzhangella halophila]MBB4930870.1 AcrR family transcriptional regulator [Lipingzhangella halophila]